jgi:hypothetical protein
MLIALNDRPVTVSTDKFKPAYIMEESDDRVMTAPAPPVQAGQDATQSGAPSPPATQTTFSGPVLAFRHGSTYDHPSPLGGDVVISHAATSGPLQSPAQPIKRSIPGPGSAAATGHHDQSEGMLFRPTTDQFIVTNQG